jgi:hypothetical protein
MSDEPKPCEGPKRMAPKPHEKPDPLADQKTTAPAVQPAVLSPREYAELYGTWSTGRANTIKRRYAYSKM